MIFFLKLSLNSYWNETTIYRSSCFLQPYTLTWQTAAPGRFCRHQAPQAWGLWTRWHVAKGRAASEGQTFGRRKWKVVRRSWSWLWKGSANCLHSALLHLNFKPSLIRSFVNNFNAIISNIHFIKTQLVMKSKCKIYLLLVFHQPLTMKKQPWNKLENMLAVLERWAVP